MMAQNLRDVGQPEAARKALWGSVVYTVASTWLLTYVPTRSSSSIFPIVAGYIGSMALEAYAKKFIGNRDEFLAKGIVKPLLICLAIFVPIVALAIYGLTISQA